MRHVAVALALTRRANRGVVDWFPDAAFFFGASVGLAVARGKCENWTRGNCTHFVVQSPRRSFYSASTEVRIRGGRGFLSGRVADSPVGIPSVARRHHESGPAGGDALLGRATDARKKARGFWNAGDATSRLQSQTQVGRGWRSRSCEAEPDTACVEYGITHRSDGGNICA